MVKNIKSHPSLDTTIVINALGGLAAGYLIGSGIEDTFNYLNISPSIEHIKIILSGVGAISLSTLGVLQYFNKDEHKGKLVVYINEEIESKKPQIEPQPNLEGLANIVEKLTTGIYNQNLANNLYVKTIEHLQKNPLNKLKEVYESSKNNLLADMFEVFTPFNYNGKEINPKETLDKFFENGDCIYNTIIENISNSAKNFIDHKSISKDQPSTEFKQILNQEIKLAEDIALWITYLSKREGVVGSNVRDKLEQFGITNPNYLARDVKILGENIMRLYN